MGRDKALVEVGGVPMADRVASALREAGCQPVVAIGGDRPALERLGLEVVADIHPGEGPLGGVITALGHSSADLVLVAACDLPFLRGDTARALLDGIGDADAALAVTDRPQPALALWRRDALPDLVAAFERGERRLTVAIEALDTVRVHVEAQDLANVNTPDDLLH